MKFIVDAQLPYGVALFIRRKGHDVIHTDDLPDKERTSDSEIRRISRDEARIVISKDGDFIESHVLSGEPAQLLWIATGNIRNRELFGLFEQYWPEIEQNLQHHHLLELNNLSLVAY